MHFKIIRVLVVGVETGNGVLPVTPIVLLLAAERQGIRGLNDVRTAGRPLAASMLRVTPSVRLIAGSRFAFRNPGR